MIGGNITAQLQISTAVNSGIGESVKAWETVDNLTGWLDLSNGDSKYTSYHMKIQESTHVLVSDFKKIDSKVTSENSRIIVNGKVYDVLLIDDPMEMHKQLEIYLKYTGGQNDE